MQEKKELSDAEIDCRDEIRAFWKGGAPGQYRLKQVLPNIWNHYQIRDQKKRRMILSLAKANDEDLLADEVYQPWNGHAASKPKHHEHVHDEEHVAHEDDDSKGIDLFCHA